MLYECYITTFVGETLNYAVLDNGYTKSVCGQSRLNSYLSYLTKIDCAKKVTEKEIFTSFKDGDGNSVRLTKAVTQSIVQVYETRGLWQNRCCKERDTISIEQRFHEEANVSIDLANNTVSVLDQKVATVFTLKG